MVGVASRHQQGTNKESGPMDGVGNPGEVDQRICIENDFLQEDFLEDGEGTLEDTQETR